MLAATEVSHWKNTISTLEWFKNIDQKENCSFIKFDNENFYTLILIPLFNKAIEFAKETCFISNDISIIMQEAPWIKKTGNENFKLPMGCFGGTDICDLVGSYIFLSKLKVMIKKEDVGLYRDDGLRVYHNLSGSQVERMRKLLGELFKQYELSHSGSLLKLDLLDVFFDLTNVTFKPYRKPSDSLVHIHVKSNHLPSIIKELPKSIGKRISNISSNEELFDNSTGYDVI